MRLCSRLLLFSRVRLCAPVDCSPPGFLSFSVSRSLLRLMSIKSVMPSNHLSLCLPFLPALSRSSIRGFSSESAPLLTCFVIYSK